MPYADAQFLALIQTARKRKKVAEDGIAGHNDKTDATEDDDTVAPVVVKTLKFVMTDDAAEQCSTGADEWQVKWSEKLGRPFFFNSKAQMGQFAVPPELEGIDINTLLQVGISGIGTEAPVSTEATSLQPQEVVISVEAPTGGRKRGRRVDESAMATQVQIPTSQAGVEIEVAEVEVSSRPPRSRRGVDVTPPPVMSPVPELNESTQSRTTRSAQKKPRLPPRRSSRTTGTDNEEVFDKEEQDQESNITEEVTEKVVEPLNEQVSAPILDSVSTLSTATIRDSVKSSQHATLPASQYDDVMRSMWETQPENSASGDSQPNLISDDEKKKLFYSDVSSKQTQEDGSQEVQLPTQVQARHSLESQSSDQSNDYPAVPGAPLINTQGSVFAVSQTIDDDDEPVLISDPDGIAGSSGSSSSSGSQYKSVSTSSGPKNWNCKHCTYLNPPLIDLCEICDKPRSPFFYAMKKEDMEAKLKKEWEKKRFTKRLGMQDLKSWKLSTSTATSSSDPSLDKSGSKLRK